MTTAERTSEAGSAAQAPRAMMTIEQILALVPVSRSTLFRMEEEGRFPAGQYVSGNRKLWFADEVIGWQNSLDRKVRRAPRHRRT